MSISLRDRARRRASFVLLVTATSLATVFVSHAAAGTTIAPARLQATKTKHELAPGRRGLEVRATRYRSSAPVTLRVDGRPLLAYRAAPTKDGAAPLTVVYLHGRHGKAENGCPWMRAGAGEVGWLVCPQGIVDEPFGVASWGADVAAQAEAVERSRRAAEREGASGEPGVAVGFSQGAYVALDILKTHRGRFRGLVLLAAPEAHPSAQNLLAAGTRRVVLGAGAHDTKHREIALDVKRLQDEGIEARFLDLGAVGHTYATDETDALRDAIAWAGGRSTNP